MAKTRQQPRNTKTNPRANGARPDARSNGHHLPPHDLVAEESLLGAMLLRPVAIEAAIGTVTADDFYKPAHGHIYAAIVELHTAGEPVDPTTVASVLRRQDLLDTIGGPATLITIQSGTPATTSAPRYARDVAKCARDRRLIGLAAEIAEAARQGNDTNAAELLQRALDDTAATDTNSWTPIDLAAVLEGGQLTQPPSILRRDDGQALIYAGKVHAFNAESESGKSWLAMWACIEQLNAGQRVIYLDFEDGAAGVTERLLALGADPDTILELFTYVRPDDPINAAAVAALTALQPALVVIDGVTEVMVQNNWSIKENDDIARLQAALPRPFARAGAAVVMIDHVVKKKDEQGADAIGGQHKRAGVDGATYKLEMIKPFGRGMAGVARITCTKDRPGHVRPACAGGKAVGEMRLASSGDHVTLTLVAPDSITNPDAAFRPTHLMERISRELEQSNAGGVKPSVRQLQTVVKGNATHKLTALRALMDDGYVTVEPGPRNAVLHVSARPYREAEDPRSDRYEPLPEPPPEAFDEDPIEPF